jgi:DNA-binding transcriptional ArsR family regulator
MEYIQGMATREKGSVDAFRALAEPRRRAIMETLARGGPHPVGELVRRLRMRQPDVSKHLHVLKRAGMVSMRSEGRMRLYRVEPAKLDAVREWVKAFDAIWEGQLGRIKELAERRARDEETSGAGGLKKDTDT